jgi:hypothetical protein
MSAAPSDRELAALASMPEESPLAESQGLAQRAAGTAQDISAAIEREHALRLS